jgi:hypothetical protein
MDGAGQVARARRDKRFLSQGKWHGTGKAWVKVVRKNRLTGVNELKTHDLKVSRH